MANKETVKTPVNRDRFMEVLTLRKCSIRKLGDVYEEVGRTEKTIRRCLEKGEMTPDLLDRIAKFLDVHPDYISGVYDRQVERISDDFLRHLVRSHITPENHPYFKKEREDALSSENYQKFFKGAFAICDISMQQFSSLPPEERVIVRQEILVALQTVICKHFKQNSFGEDTFEQLAYYQSMVGDMDNRLAVFEGISLEEPDFGELEELSDGELPEWERRMREKHGAIVK